MTLGVLGYRPDPLVMAKYQPLADYLSRETGRDITIRVLAQEEMDRAVASNRIDFFLTNPAHFLMIRSERSLAGVLATLQRDWNGITTGSIGGVISPSRAQRYSNSGRLARKSIATPGLHYLEATRPRPWSCSRQAWISGGITGSSIWVTMTGWFGLCWRETPTSALSAPVFWKNFCRKTGAGNRAEGDQRPEPPGLSVPAFNPPVSGMATGVAAPCGFPHHSPGASALFALEPDDPAAVAAGLASFAPRPITSRWNT